MTGPPPSVTVRPATLADVDAVVAMLAEVAGEGRWIGTEAPVDVEQRRRRMVEDVEREEAIVLVAEAGGQVVGELGLYLARYGVADLGMAVAAGWRGRGIGSALLAEAIDRARDGRRPQDRPPGLAPQPRRHRPLRALRLPARGLPDQALPAPLGRAVGRDHHGPATGLTARVG